MLANRQTSENIKMKEICRNCLHIFTVAFKVCPIFLGIYILLMALISAVDSVIIIALYKYLLDCVKNSVEFETMAQVLIMYGGGCGLLTISIRSILEKWYDIKIMDVNKVINRKLFKKAVSMDISNYDDREYYDKYIRAMEQGEMQVSAAIRTGTKLLSMATSIVSLTSMIIFINQTMVIFPLLASVIHFCTHVYNTKIRFNMQVEMTTASRKKAYCRRIFYQPEYTKEIRMTKISKVHEKIFKEATRDEIEIVTKYSKKLRKSMLLNDILGWVLLVYYLPMQYLVYNALVIQKMSVGDVAAMNEANQSLISSLDDLTVNMIGLQEIGLFGRHYRRFLDMESTIEMRKGEEINSKIPKVIEFKNVSFSYSNNDYILKNISIKIEPGQKIAIVGYNGSGKTTFAKLLLNYYLPTDGNIYYDGKIIEKYDCKSYRKNFGILFQDFQIYALSLDDNVKMGENNNNSLTNAMKLADIYDRILELPKHEKSILTREFDDDGIMLSGGESQRIALARLYLQRKPIIVLDEHTSAMDPITEKKINDTIFSEFKDHTIICISHHLTSICKADYIYFFENGEIKEQGTHDMLMNLNNRYKLMFDKQSSYFKDASEK